MYVYKYIFTYSICVDIYVPAGQVKPIQLVFQCTQMLMKPRQHVTPRRSVQIVMLPVSAVFYISKKKN